MTSDIFHSLLANVSRMPPQLLAAVAELGRLLGNTPSSGGDAASPRRDPSQTSVATIIFLKLIGPLLCSGPKLWETLAIPLKKGGPESTAIGFSLSTIAKLLQTLANGSVYDVESPMHVFNPFLESLAPLFSQYADELVKSAPAPCSIVSPPLPPDQAIHHYRRLFNQAKRFMPALTALCQSGPEHTRDLPDRIRASLVEIETARKKFELRSAPNGLVSNERRHSDSALSTKPRDRAKKSGSSQNVGLYRVGHR